MVKESWEGLALLAGVLILVVGLFGGACESRREWKAFRAKAFSPGEVVEVVLTSEKVMVLRIAGFERYECRLSKDRTEQPRDSLHWQTTFFKHYELRRFGTELMPKENDAWVGGGGRSGRRR